MIDISELRLRYRSWFSIEEIEGDLTLQRAFWVLLLTFVITFYLWFDRSMPSVNDMFLGAHTCWPYFQSCEFLNVLWALPFGYSFSTLYAALFALLVFSGYRALEGKWIDAHAALVAAYVWKAFVVFVMAMNAGGNYDYYDLILLTVFLFFPHKMFFLRVSFVFLYVLASTIKLDGGWVLGTFFTSLAPGLALFGNAIAPLITNTVIGMQMVGSWFLMSGRAVLQRAALGFFLLFHLYSIIYVGYRYPITTIPMLLVLFGPLYARTHIPLDRSSILGWLLLVLMFLAQFTPILIQGNHRLTLEGNQYGLYMFEANHQCVSTETLHFSNGSSTTNVIQSRTARDRCDPYRIHFRLKNLCEDARTGIERVEWTFDHSINGGPFLRIVDQGDACALTYAPFSHNPWILTHADDPPIIGYPVENFYY